MPVYAVTVPMGLYRYYSTATRAVATYNTVGQFEKTYEDLTFANDSEDQSSKEEKKVEDAPVSEEIKKGLNNVGPKEPNKEPDGEPANDNEKEASKRLEDIEITQDIKDGLEGVLSDGSDLDANDRTFADRLKEKAINEDTGKEKGIARGGQEKMENADSIIEDRETALKESKIQEILKSGSRWGNIDYAKDGEDLKMDNLVEASSNEQFITPALTDDEMNKIQEILKDHHYQLDEEQPRKKVVELPIEFEPEADIDLSDPGDLSDGSDGGDGGSSGGDGGE